MHCLIELLYASGLRVSELVSLPRTARGRERFLVVRGKGRKERLVPLTEAARDRRHLPRLPGGEGGTGGPWLFPSMASRAT